MTLPSSGSISTDQILAELRIANSSRAYPLSLTDADVLSLAGKSAPPVTMPDDFYGKSATPPTPPAQPMTLYPNGTNAINGTVPAGGQSVSIQLSVAVTGGARPLTYSWTNISSVIGLARVTGTDGPMLSFERTVAAGSNGNATAQGQCTVTDANGVSKSTGLINGSVTWGNA